MLINAQDINWNAEKPIQGKLQNPKKSDYNSTTLSRFSKTAKEEYVDRLCTKFPNAHINISNSYGFSSDRSTTLNVSSGYLEKAMTRPEASQNLERLAGLSETFPQYLNTHNILPDGRQITNVSFLVDENGGVSCMCEYKNSNAKQTHSLPSLIEKLEQRKNDQLEANKENPSSCVADAYKKKGDNPMFFFSQTV